MDLVDAQKTDGTVAVFQDKDELREYLVKSGSFFPKRSPLAGGVLNHLLRWKFGDLEEQEQGKKWGQGRGNKRRTGLALKH